MMELFVPVISFIFSCLKNLKNTKIYTPRKVVIPFCILTLPPKQNRSTSLGFKLDSFSGLGVVASFFWSEIRF
ncbi:MAG: putative 8 kDa protein [Plant associated closterovirus 2]|nr:MAG: putative 8 kDa protein [Plant associated closterovirus 2]